MLFKHKISPPKLFIFLCFQFLLAICFVVESKAEIRKIVVTPAEQSAKIYSCLEYQITFLDENDKVVPAETDLQFKIADPSEQLELFTSTDLFSDNCTGTPITDGTFTVPAGQSFGRILIKSSVPIESNVSLEGVNTPVAFGQILPIQFTYTDPAQLKFLTSEANPRPGLCTRFDFGYFDENGSPATVDSPHTLNFTLMPEAPGLLFSDLACTQPLSEYEVLPGQSEGSIYARFPENFSGRVYVNDESRKGVMFIETAAINYDDVGVIVNQNSRESRKIARYFMTKRNIPFQNLFYINAPTTEIISDAEFQAVRAQLEAQLPAHNDPNRVINYLVTTKGLPLGIQRDNPVDPTSISASFESEIALLAGPHVDKIGQIGWLINPYFNQSKVFSRADQGFFLVTRLDAYTIQEVLDLIDRSGPLTPVNVVDTLSVFDRDPLRGFTTHNNELSRAAAIMSGRGYPAELNTDTTYVTNRENVLAYGSWGSNDSNFPWSIGPALPMFSWVNGSIAETFVSTSARSFMPGTPYGQSLIADLLVEGVCGVKGYVFEPWTTAIAQMDIVTERYTRGHNLVESFAMGSIVNLSWMDVVIGDPKMSIVPVDR
ncbi:MAG: TIGR03790 family protein [Candidatus Omnitrophica bacterium]|nr:TIGR03790 family protein [Candidatus Omnitrophota bacterium]